MSGPSSSNSRVDSSISGRFNPNEAKSEPLLPGQPLHISRADGMVERKLLLTPAFLLFCRSQRAFCTLFLVELQERHPERSWHRWKDSRSFS